MRTLEALCKLNDTKAEVYLVGGFVRDFIRRKKNKDLDIVVRYMALSQISDFLSTHGKVKELIIHRNHGPKADPIKFLSFFGSDGVEAQITTVKGSGEDRNPNATLKQDGKHRDFTINSMYLPVNNITSKAVIDHFGGKNDIAAKQVLTVGSAKAKFVKSPIRILRAFSIAARTGYNIHDHVKVAISANVHLLAGVPMEAIRAEFEDILLSAKPSKYFKMMQKLGVLKMILPELEATVYCKQDKRYHKYNVFEHLLYSCDNIEPDLILRLAAILHDIGKPASRNKINNHVTFYKHEVYGARLARVILKRLRYDKVTINKVTHLVRMHMYHYTREFTDAAVRRFIVNAGITKDNIENLADLPLFKVRAAERLGNGFKKTKKTQKQYDYEDRIKSVFESSAGFSINDLAIDGNDLMDTFSMPPGRNIGELLKYLLSLVMSTPDINNKKDLLRASLEFIINEKEKHE